MTLKVLEKCLTKNDAGLYKPYHKFNLQQKQNTFSVSYALASMLLKFVTENNTKSLKFMLSFPPCVIRYMYMLNFAITGYTCPLGTSNLIRIKVLTTISLGFC